MVPPSVVRPDVPHVVGIGASAGGLEALEQFFDNLPRDTGMAFVVVQHLSPDFKSLMDELLARHTQLPIRLVEDGMRVEPDHVYLIPPKKEMIISEGVLLLSERDTRQQELSLPIDVFFRSLAQDCGSRAIAIVLSGSGSDGSRGARDVAESGGLVIVQDTSAQFDGMPRTTRDTGVAAHVLAPAEMPRVLLEHARDRAAEPRREPAAPGGLDAVYAMLQEEFGIDFTHYKPNTITRRIERRLHLSHAHTMAGYVERLKRGRDELDVLYRDLLIGVTRFFRNEEAFAILERRVLPDLFRRGPPDTPLRVWIAGCATGEEAYSLAIVLHELSQRFGDRPLKIFASDVHRGSLEVAARAIYDEEAIKNVSRERLERYFVRRGRSYQVAPELRQLLVFAPHNVIRDAPFTRVDLVTCRNLLIYLQPAAQQKVLSLFHFALNRGGVVFLGPSETPGALAHDFEVLDRHWRIYRKYSDARIPVDTRLQPVRQPSAPRIPLAPPSLPRYSLTHLLGTYDALLDRYMPPSLLVSDQGELVHSFGGASRFMRIRDGRAGLDVLDVVSPELKMILVGGLKRAAKETEPIVFTGVRIAADEGEGTYRVGVQRVAGRPGAQPHVLVTFEPMDAASEPVPSREHEIDVSQASKEQIGALEAELSYTKENLQAAIEELETSNEELQATNEELLASNEELQSTNEELQSVNEELYTVNAEYQRKIAELTELTNDMDNLLSSTDVGTIFLDTKLRIRKFTPQIGEEFNLLPQDVGRSIATFTHNIDHPGLKADLERVLETGAPIERELAKPGGETHYLRILPYRAKGAIGGVVLTLIDVTGLKQAEDALFHERYLLDSLLVGVPDAIYFRDARGRFIRANHEMARRLGLADPREAVGKTPFELCAHDVAMELHAEDDRVLRTGEAQHYRLEKQTRSDGSSAWSLVSRLPLRDRSNAIVGVVTVLRDITAQKLAEEKVQDDVRRRDEFLAMLSHELRNPLGAMVTATALLRGEADGQGADGAPRPKRARLLAILERQARQMSRLLEDLLEASRVTQNKIELRKSAVDLRLVARDAVESMRSAMERRGLTFSVDLGDEPLFVDGDPARLLQVQVNLLSNAAKYTPAGGHVSLSLRRADGRAVVRVRDDGVGIRKELLDGIFEMFVQCDRTLDRADGGLGLGLTLVRALVAMHGGDVTATSDGEGKGSEFVVRLPARPASASVPPPARSPERAARGGALDAASPRSSERVALARGARVVVVEDNADSREMLCELLGLAGFDCHAAGDGASGLALIDDVEPEVAIVDVGLPGMNGFEVARRIRADARHARMYLVALTGYGRASDRAEALAAGFDEHLVKPVETRELMALLGSEPRATRSSAVDSA
jgi:two-component system CheB/CheR fusion protein